MTPIRQWIPLKRVMVECTGIVYSCSFGLSYKPSMMQYIATWLYLLNCVTRRWRKSSTTVLRKLSSVPWADWQEQTVTLSSHKNKGDEDEEERLLSVVLYVRTQLMIPICCCQTFSNRFVSCLSLVVAGRCTAWIIGLQQCFRRGRTVVALVTKHFLFLPVMFDISTVLFCFPLVFTFYSSHWSVRECSRMHEYTTKHDFVRADLRAREHNCVL